MIVPLAASLPLQIAGDASLAAGDAPPEAATQFAALLDMLGISVESHAQATPEARLDISTDQPETDQPEDEPKAGFDESELDQAIASGLAAVLALAARPSESVKAAPATAMPPIATTAAAHKTAAVALRLDGQTEPSTKKANADIAAMIRAAALGTVPKTAPVETPAATPVPSPELPALDAPASPDGEAAPATPPATATAALPLPPVQAGLTPATAPPDAASSQAIEMQPRPSADIAIQHQLDLAHDGAWLDRLARDIAQTANRDAQLRFQLNPEHLGSLRVELASGADGTAIRLTADTDAARAILADAQPRLLAEARAQGLRISEAHVDLGGQSGHQRRHAEDQQPFIRTALAAEPTTESPRTAAERYA